MAQRVAFALACAAAVAAGEVAPWPTDELFRMQRAMGLDVARRIALEDPLAGLADTKVRGIIERVCAEADTGGTSLGVVDEATMCKRHGRRIADTLAKYPPRLNAEHVDRVRALFSKDHEHPNSGMWVRVERGVVVAQEYLGKKLFMHHASHSGLLAMLNRAGALSEDMTFEYITLFGDGCGWDPTLFTSPNGTSTVPWLPLISYSKSKWRCPNRVVLHQQPWLQQYPTPTPFGWDQLNDTAKFRGTLSSMERLHLSAISALNVIPDAKVDFTLALARGKLPEHAALNEEYRELCEKWLVDVVAIAGYGRNVTNPCVRDPARPDVPPLIFKEEGKTGYQLDHKYLVSADGYAGVARFSEYFAASGVVLSFPSAWEQFYTDDVVPWVHYVPLQSGIVGVADNIRDTLAFLRANDPVAQDISAAASDFHAKHLTNRAHARAWQIFFKIYNAMWDDAESTDRKPHDGSALNPRVACGNIRDNPSFKLNKFGEFIYDQACVQPLRSLQQKEALPQRRMRVHQTASLGHELDVTCAASIIFAISIVLMIVRRSRGSHKAVE